MTADKKKKEQIKKRVAARAKNLLSTLAVNAE